MDSSSDAWSEVLDRLVASLNPIMVTVLKFTNQGTRMERITSSHPKDYPVGGSKTVTDQVSAEWLRECRDQGRAVLAETPAEIRQIFQDADLIESLGIGSLMTIPLIDTNHHVSGCVSISGPAGAYDSSHVEAAKHQLRHTAPLLHTEVHP